MHDECEELLVFDTPRSGNEYPQEFLSPAPFDAVRRSVSMYVEELYTLVPKHGCTWLYALFPNVYIDANRHELDIDPAYLDGQWGRSRSRPPTSRSAAWG